MANGNGKMGKHSQDGVRDNDFTVTLLSQWIFNSVENTAELAAVGFGLPPSTFTDAGKYGYVSGLTSMFSILNSCRQPSSLGAHGE